MSHVVPLLEIQTLRCVYFLRSFYALISPSIAELVFFLPEKLHVFVLIFSMFLKHVPA